jgi:NitT/TauT family transport system substrate-binding protein
MTRHASGPIAVQTSSWRPRAPRAIALAIGAVFLIGGLSLGITRADAADLTTFKVGMASPANTFLAIWMAQEAGFYESQGLKVEIVPMVGGSKSGPALKSGQIQLMHIGMSSVVRANMMGIGDLRVVGSLSNVIRHTMFTAPNVKTAADLKGGTVGISSVGSESDSTATLALRKLGLTRQDVTIKEIGVDRLTVVRNGGVSATVLGEPQRSEAYALGLNPIVDLYADHIAWLYSGLTVDNTYRKAHPDVLKRFFKATVEGNYLAVADATRAKGVLAKELKIKDPKVLDISYDNFKSETPINAEIDRKGAENVVATVVPENGSKRLDDYINTSITDGLRAEGYFDAMQKKYGMH